MSKREDAIKKLIENLAWAMDRSQEEVIELSLRIFEFFRKKGKDGYLLIRYLPQEESPVRVYYRLPIYRRSQEKARVAGVRIVVKLAVWLNDGCVFALEKREPGHLHWESILVVAGEEENKE